MSIPAASKPRFSPLERRVLITLILLGLVLPVGFIVWRISISIKIHYDLAALRKAGYPISMEDLERMYYPKFKPEENAATFFTEAFQHLVLNGSEHRVIGLISSYGKLPRGAIHLSGEDKERIAKVLAENREALETLRKIPPASTCRYPADASLGMDIKLPHLESIGSAVELLLLDAILDAGDNKPAETTENLLAALRLTKSLAEDPWLASQQCRVKCRAEIYSSLENVLNTKQLGEVQLLELSRAFHREENSQAVEHAMACFCCMLIQAFEMSGPEFDAPAPDPSDSYGLDLQPSTNTVRMGVKFLKLTGFKLKEYDIFLRTVSRDLADLKLPFPGKLDAAAETQRMLGKERPGEMYPVSVMPHATSVLISHEAHDLACLYMTQTALAIERYRLATQDRIPDKLDDLVPSLLPSVPADPFDGKPLRFKKLPKGYMVYSIGPDRKDDDGVERNPKKPGSAEDITFTVER
ncbi:MAG: hypothetical protein JWR26_534 [Pedosphaera sp.]|nr:hypothetical protein [Pedosphaera sp.]